MSKYNHSESLDISEIPEEELKQAIHEWAQGNDTMEKLLWACKERGIKTMGCHPLGQPYIDLVVNNSQNEIRKMLYAAQNLGESTVLLAPDGGNPLGGSFDMPILCIGFNIGFEEDVKYALEELYKSIYADESEITPEFKVFDYILDFHDFFINKESDLLIYIESSKERGYEFMIRPKSNIEYYSELFQKAGLVEKDGMWTFSSKDPLEFSEKLEKSKEIIFQEYSLEPRDEIDYDMSETLKCRIVKRKFGDTSEGQEKFKAWLEEYKKIAYEIIDINRKISELNPEENKDKIASLKIYIATLKKKISDLYANIENFKVSQEDQDSQFDIEDN